MRARIAVLGLKITKFGSKIIMGLNILILCQGPRTWSQSCCEISLFKYLSVKCLDIKLQSVTRTSLDS